MPRLAPLAVIWLTLAALAAPAMATTPAMTAKPGEHLTIPASSGWEVILDVCGQIGTIGPSGSTYYIGPPDTATFGATDPAHVLGLSDSIDIDISPSVHPGVVIVASWTSFHDGCFSAHGGITITVSEGGPAPGGTSGAPPPAGPSPVAGSSPPKKTLSASRKKFAATALPLARAIIPLARKIKRAAKRPSERKRLLSSLRRRAKDAAGVFDLGRLSRPLTWKLNAPGVGLRTGQLNAMPGFASDLKKISEYDKVMLDKADAKYANDPDFRYNVDQLSALQFSGRTYAQLNRQEQATIASQVQPQSGALQTLLQWARNVGKSASRVVFGK
jgi:hypothetical protein